jgi:hypothetical protein
MKTNLKTIAVAAALLGAAAPAFAQSQLIGNAGLTPAEASGLSLTEIAAAKFNRGSDDDNQQRVLRDRGVTVISRSADGAARPRLIANAGLTPEQARGLSLTQIAAAKFNRDSDDENQQRARRVGDVTVISRSASAAAWSQLAANAGLSPEEARGLSLSEIAAAKFARESDDN